VREQSESRMIPGAPQTRKSPSYPHFVCTAGTAEKVNPSARRRHSVTSPTTTGRASRFVPRTRTSAQSLRANDERLQEVE
jgi:hypothetical protein